MPVNAKTPPAAAYAWMRVAIQHKSPREAAHAWETTTANSRLVVFAPRAIHPTL